MRIQYASDFHLEFSANRRYLYDHPLPVLGDVLLLAGDILPITSTHIKDEFFSWLSDHFAAVYLIPGNHEYYAGHEVSAKPLREALRVNVHLVNNVIVDLEEIDLVCSTLWSRIVKRPEEVTRWLTDFHRIRQQGELIDVTGYNELFKAHLAFLESHIYRPRTKPRIVLTHHLPSLQCNAPEFRHSPVNEGFVTELSSSIVKAEVDHWIYGHSHRNLPSFQIGNTWLHSNQLGYVQLGENRSFRPDAIIDI